MLFSTFDILCLSITSRRTVPEGALTSPLRFACLLILLDEAASSFEHSVVNVLSVPLGEEAYRALAVGFSALAGRAAFS